MFLIRSWYKIKIEFRIKNLNSNEVLRKENFYLYLFSKCLITINQKAP